MVDVAKSFLMMFPNFRLFGTAHAMRCTLPMTPKSWIFLLIAKRPSSRILLGENLKPRLYQPRAQTGDNLSMIQSSGSEGSFATENPKG